MNTNSIFGNDESLEAFDKEIRGFRITKAVDFPLPNRSKYGYRIANSHIEDCGFSFNGFRLENVRITDSALENVDFSGAVLASGKFFNVNFIGCNFNGALIPSPYFDGVVFDGCTFKDTSLHSVQLGCDNHSGEIFKGWQFINCELYTPGEEKLFLEVEYAQDKHRKRGFIGYMLDIPYAIENHKDRRSSVFDKPVEVSRTNYKVGDVLTSDVLTDKSKTNGAGIIAGTGRFCTAQQLRLSKYYHRFVEKYYKIAFSYEDCVIPYSQHSPFGFIRLSACQVIDVLDGNSFERQFLKDVEERKQRYKGALESI